MLSFYFVTILISIELRCHGGGLKRLGNFWAKLVNANVMMTPTCDKYIDVTVTSGVGNDSTS